MGVAIIVQREPFLSSGSSSNSRRERARTRVLRGSGHYVPPTRAVRGDYSNDSINHVPPQEAFIIIEILAPFLLLLLLRRSLARLPLLPLVFFSSSNVDSLGILLAARSAFMQLYSPCHPRKSNPKEYGLACLLSRNHEAPPRRGGPSFLPRF